MELLTKEILKKFKDQGDTSNMKPEDIKIIVKYFSPVGSAMWWCYEYNEKDRIFWCFAFLGNSDFAECGTLSLDELESVELPYGLKIERDMWYGYDHTLAEVIKEVKGR
jgi:hypothetical protein